MLEYVIVAYLIFSIYNLLPEVLLSQHIALSIPLTVITVK